MFYPLIEGRQAGWPAWSFISLAGAAPLLAAFCLLEFRKARTGRAPLVSPGLFTSRQSGVGLAIAMLFFGATSFFFALTLFLQFGLGYSPLRTGLAFLPFSLGIVVGSGGAAPLGQKYGRYAITAGAVLMTLAILSMIAVIHAAGSALTGWQLAPSLAAAGLAFGVVSGTLADVVLARIPREQASAASGVVSTVIQLGSVTAITVVGVIFFSLLGRELTATGFVDAVTGGLGYLALACTAAAGLSLCLPSRAGRAATAGNPASDGQAG